MKIWVNVVAFQVGWLICLIYQGFWAWAYALIYLIIHLALIRKPGEVKFIFLATIAGILIDSWLVVSGVFDFGRVALVIPGWLMALWILFATTIHHTFSWLKHRFLTAIVLGAVGGSASYFGGYQLGLVSFPLGLPVTLAIIALIWAVFFPLLLQVSKQND